MRKGKKEYVEEMLRADRRLQEPEEEVERGQRESAGRRWARYEDRRWP